MPLPPYLAKVELLSHLVSLGDGFFDRAEQMAKVGLSSFQPLLSFRESFCNSKEDIAAHRRYQMEISKERLGNVFPHMYLRDDDIHGYRSPFLAELRLNRKREGRAFDVYDKSKPWLVELSPCRFAEKQMNYSDPAEYDKRKKPALEEHRRLRHKETEFFATSLSGKFGFEKSDRMKLSKAVLASALEPKGFKYDRAQSKSGTIVFSKLLLPNWVLCWLVDGARIFSPVGIREQDQIGSLDLSLEIRYQPTNNASERVKFDNCQIPYNHVAPIDGLDWLYGRFNSQAELETLIRAHLFVYDLVDSHIETELKRALQ